MDDLPQELVDNISSFLAYDDLKNTLTVSAKFQVAAELCSRAFEKYTLTEDNAATFLTTYNGRRAHYLRRIRFRPMLPALDDPDDDPEDELRPCRENSEDLKLANEHFSKQIEFLLSTLAKLEQRIRRPMNGRGADIKLTIYTPRRLVLDEAFYCRHRMYVSWPLQLLSPDRLPSIDFIHTLVFKNGHQYDPLSDDCNEMEPSLRSLDLRIMLDLASKMNGLRNLKCRVGGETLQSHIRWTSTYANHIRSGWDGPLRDSRKHFADALNVLRLPDLEEGNLDFMYPLKAADAVDQRVRMPDLVAPAIYDAFSSALRILSLPLKRLRLQGAFDASLFWPANDNSSFPHWPNLEILNVSFYAAAPSGAWYFRGLEPEPVIGGFEITDGHYQPLTTTEEDQETDRECDYPDWEMTNEAQFRVIPVDEIITPFLAAFTKAANSMPALREAALWSPCKLQPDDMGGSYEALDETPLQAYTNGKLAWGIVYTAPGTPHKLYGAAGTTESDARQIWWNVTDWRPAGPLHSSFQTIGLDTHGDKLLEYWSNEHGQQGLVRRGVFEGFTSDGFW
ncbi:hypothetical protein OPT61_g3180 [Boeremia exigua]|uniref:Uncharacterized protein n=1 Tax=Boeremia exigua TaxID=749465 RepID=A0ACC2IIW0_9PLEO|nr:hypothetical protein OPT61_g3180 [Boeremia exigua]